MKSRMTPTVYRLMSLVPSLVGEQDLQHLGWPGGEVGVRLGGAPEREAVRDEGRDVDARQGVPGHGAPPRPIPAPRERGRHPAHLTAHEREAAAVKMRPQIDGSALGAVERADDDATFGARELEGRVEGGGIPREL